MDIEDDVVCFWSFGIVNAFVDSARLCRSCTVALATYEIHERGLVILRRSG